MNELTIVIDHLGDDELKDYLMSLKGILQVIVKKDERLKIYIKYNSDLITLKIIKMEILLFLDIIKIPSIIAFDKHTTVKTSDYEISRCDICCEYCLKGAIEELFEIAGIEKVETNFYKNNYYQKKKDERDNVLINIKYNPTLISNHEMEQIELKLNI